MLWTENFQIYRFYKNIHQPQAPKQPKEHELITLL